MVTTEPLLCAGAKTLAPPVRSRVPPVMVRLPVKALAALVRVRVPEPTLAMESAKPVCSVMRPAKVASAFLPPTESVPAKELVVTVPVPARLPIVSAAADIARVLPAARVTRAVSGMPFRAALVATPTCRALAAVEVTVTSPTKVLAATLPTVARVEPAKVTLPVPVMPEYSVRSAPSERKVTSRLRAMPLKPSAPTPVTPAVVPMVTAPVVPAATTIGAVR